MTREHDPAVEAVIDSLIADTPPSRIRALNVRKGSLTARVIARLRGMLTGNLIADAEEGEGIGYAESAGYAVYEARTPPMSWTHWVHASNPSTKREAIGIPDGALLLVPRKTEERLTREAKRIVQALTPRTTKPRAKTTKPRRSSSRR